MNDREQPLRIVFWDLLSDPADPSNWSGIPWSTMNGLLGAGQHVTVAGPVFPRLRRAVSSALWHFHHRITRKHYIPDRDASVVRFFSWIGNRTLKHDFDGADAILTTSVTATAFLKTNKPIFIIHDATWAQVLELYSYFHPSLQVSRIVRDGFQMEAATFTRPNVSLVLASKWVAGRVLTDYRIDPARVHVVPMGANFQEDPPREQVERAIADRKGEICQILFVGREFDRKGGSIAVETVCSLRERGVDARLHVVGCLPQGLPNWVNVHGLLRKDNPIELQRLLKLYETSDFFLLPTRAEAQGIVFNEAAAFGLPTAATDVGGVSTVVPDGGWGMLFPLDANGSAYADRLLGVFKDRDLYRSLALQAREDYEQRLSRTAYTRQLLSIIRSTVDHPDVSGSSL